ncbi:aminoacyl-tRNA deacylase [Azohydromonas caseinilytica]|uniref:YbaK/EbsC family protein n=1 Tax=Azohydromonas caseinilytica TaxID=2728836 RepID=A0A848FAG9_9BURK|nr:YbaK/EbsC family protein [Azohydromonas caseinilytica]NML15439.1 YbaK/EbsC family protein [Azohydromonas caseinilytica]
MSIPSRLSNYLQQHGTRYELCMHPHSRSSAETARSAHVPPSQLAKAVMLEDQHGCVIAVLPADKSVMPHEVAELLGRQELRLVKEPRLGELLDGCEPGAVPPVGMAWGMETVVDDELEQRELVYLECGDHESLLRLTQEQFHALMHGARWGRIGRAPMH